MKKETIMGRLAKGGWLKKDGHVKASVTSMHYYLQFLAKGLRYHPLTWGSGWSSLEGQSKYDNMVRLLTSLRIPFTEGNDAPKGGITGRYIEVKASARRRLGDMIPLIQ